MSEDFFRMTSHRPYLLRALVEWINDNELTPHILVDAGVPGVQVPPSSVKDDRVVLNIAERAVVRLMIDNEMVSFSARFSGVSYPVQVPISAVLAVYARETGQGMALPDDIPGAEPAEVAEDAAHESATPADDLPPDGTPPSSPPSKGRPTLRVVK
ncbi:MAG: Stringent starvation protein B [Stenotrophomonas maltophilia]|uniref:Stringent starvation protein B n=1 Tax=Stenotrophomonas maltophilia TaxID=40324 RepID=A0A7V8FIM1_STEMA|nr:MAG: Stringent starvation protein B [Stenotrophomonas maltophilia]